MRNPIVSVILAAFPAIAPNSANAADGDRAACRDLVLDYAWYWDHNNHENR